MLHREHVMTSQHFIACWYIQLIWLRLKLKAELYEWILELNAVYISPIAWGMAQDKRQALLVLGSNSYCQGPRLLEVCLLQHNPFFVYFYGLMIFSLALPSFMCQVIKGLIEAWNTFYYFPPAIKFVRWLHPQQNIHFQSAWAGVHGPALRISNGNCIAM